MRSKSFTPPAFDGCDASVRPAASQRPSSETATPKMPTVPPTVRFATGTIGFGVSSVPPPSPPALRKNAKYPPAAAIAGTPRSHARRVGRAGAGDGVGSAGFVFGSGVASDFGVFSQRPGGVASASATGSTSSGGSHSPVEGSRRLDATVADRSRAGSGVSSSRPGSDSPSPSEVRSESSAWSISRAVW